MKESYVEGVASHDDPKSCACPLEGAGEALTGARAGWAIEPRNHMVWGADAVHLGGRQHAPGRRREPLGDLTRSKNPSMCGISMRENREVPSPPAVDSAAGRVGKSKDVRR